MKKSITSVLLSLLLLPGLVLAQDATITGTVTDGDGAPLIGANVVIPSLVQGASTDLNGNYTFTVPGSMVNGQTVTLQAGFVGFSNLTKEITLTAGTQTHDFQLSEDLLKLDEVVVTGVTEATPTKKLAFTVARLDTETIQQAPGTSAVESMQGKIAGASIVRNSGAPGEGLSVRLRGSTSITGNSQPLYIVDGVILGADQVDVDALDIESLEVVKGAAASSLYGARAQNGVINITTSRGTNLPLNQTRVTIRNEFGFNELENNIRANNSHALRIQNGQFLDVDGNPVDYGPEAAVDTEINSGIAFADNPYPGTTYDAFDAFFDPGNTMTNYVAVSQNGLKTNFHASFTNLDEAGIVQGLDGLQRQSVRINLDHRINQKLNMSASAFYSTSENDGHRTSTSEASAAFNPFFGLMFTVPIVDLGARDANGNLAVQADPLSLQENPVYLVENTDILNQRSRVLGNFRGRYSPADWVDIDANFSFDRSDRDFRRFYDRGFETIDPGAQNQGQILRENALSEAINYDITASFRQRFGDLTLRSQLKYQHEDQDRFSEFVIGSELAAKGITDLSNIAGQGSKQFGNTKSVVRSDGYYGTFGIDYDDKYIADFLIRRDGSSLFGPDERWHNYFRVSGAYRVSEEAWWPLADAIPEFKLRGSYGTAGGRPRFEAQYETFSLVNGQLTKNTLGNSKLKPELQSELELGVDIGILDRFFLEVVYSDSEVEDQLLPVPLPGYFGFGAQWQNAGTLSSNTIEATLSANIIRTADMSLDIGFTFDRTEQEITEFNANPFRGGSTSAFYFREGEVLGAMYGDRWITDASDLSANHASAASLFDTDDNGYLVPVGSGNTHQDGITKSLWGTLVDVNGDMLPWGMPVKFVGEDGSAFQQIGDVLPDFSLGLPVNFRYKGFSAGLLLNAQIGGDVYNATAQWAYRDDRHFAQDQAGVADNLKKPTSYFQALYNANGDNSHFVEDGTYFKLRELALNYTFDRNALSSVFGNALERVTIGFVGRNLFTITDYTGFDPEVGSVFNQGGNVGADASLYRVDNFAYPNYRTYTGKLEIQF